MSSDRIAHVVPWVPICRQQQSQAERLKEGADSTVVQIGQAQVLAHAVRSLVEELVSMEDNDSWYGRTCSPPAGEFAANIAAESSSLE